MQPRWEAGLAAVVSSGPAGLAAILFLALIGSGFPVLGAADGYRLSGIGFSPYIDGQDPNNNAFISQQQIEQRMAIIAPFTNWVRTFGCGNGLSASGQVAHGLGKLAAIGVWLGEDLAANDREVSCAISVAQAGEADMVIVGSEALLRGDVTEQQLLAYMSAVRQQIPSGVPVTTADVYGILLGHPAVMQASDVILANFYPYWEGYPIDYAVCGLSSMYQQVVAAAAGKQVIVSETGWPSSGNTVGSAIPSAANSAAYFIGFVSWARANNVQYFYFEAFDELWKASSAEGPQGAAFGIWDHLGNLKPGMQPVFDGQVVTIECAGAGYCGDPGTPGIAFTFMAPQGDGRPVYGVIGNHLKASDYNVASYIRVNGGWWTKPTFAQPVVPIHGDCTFFANINTGGTDYQADRVYACVVPVGYTPPQAGGGALPDLGANAIACADADRGPYSICGSITGNGAPLSGVTVALSGSSSATTQTVGTGEYCFPVLTNGATYTVTPAKVTWEFNPQSQTVLNLNGHTTADFTAVSVPGPPSQPRPSDAATHISISVTLAWMVSGSVTSNTVYLGKANPPVTQLGTTIASTYDIHGLSYGTTYYWKVVSAGPNGSAESPVWSFTTAAGPPALRFVSAGPCRVVDTRWSVGSLGGPLMSAGSTRTFPIPDSACGIPADAAAYVFNVAVVPVPNGARLGYRTVWPSGQTMPLAATLNDPDGRVKSNGTIVAAGTSGAVDLYATDATHVIFDITGYFVPASEPAALSFYPVTPCRVADTRSSNAPFMTGGQTRTFPMGDGVCGVPAGAGAYALNITVAPKAGTLSYLTAFPAGATQPETATLNDKTGTTLGNAAIIPAGSGGAVSVYVTHDTEVIMDVNGYFAAPEAGGLSLYAITPCRVADTRPDHRLTAGETRAFDFTAGACVLPATTAYALNATVVPSGRLGWITMWPAGQPMPTAATLNSIDGVITGNAPIVPAANGVVSTYSTGDTQLIVEDSGYFAP